MKLNYTQVLDLGFKRIDVKDEIFFQQNGYHYFIVELKIGKYSFEWDTRTHEINMFKNNILIANDIPVSTIEYIKRKSVKRKL